MVLLLVRGDYEETTRTTLKIALDRPHVQQDHFAFGCSVPGKLWQCPHLYEIRLLLQ